MLYSLVMHTKSILFSAGMCAHAHTQTHTHTCAHERTHMRSLSLSLSLSLTSANVKKKKLYFTKTYHYGKRVNGWNYRDQYKLIKESYCGLLIVNLPSHQYYQTINEPMKLDKVSKQTKADVRSLLWISTTI